MLLFRSRGNINDESTQSSRESSSTFVLFVVARVVPGKKLDIARKLYLP